MFTFALLITLISAFSFVVRLVIRLMDDEDNFHPHFPEASYIEHVSFVDAVGTVDIEDDCPTLPGFDLPSLGALPWRMAMAA